MCEGHERILLSLCSLAIPPAVVSPKERKVEFIYIALRSQ